jgi:hypothetical protein
MKHLKTYNESIKDFLKPKSNEQTDKELSILSNKEIIEKSFKNNYINGLKIAVDNGLSNIDIKLIIDKLCYNTPKQIFEYLLSVKEIREKINENEIYIIDKYIFGLHQDKMIECEKWFLEQLTDLNIYRSKNDKDILIYEKEENILFKYNEKLNIFYYNYNKIYSIFKTTFNLNYLYVNLIIINMVKKYFKIIVDTIKHWEKIE